MKKVQHQYESEQHYLSGLEPYIRAIDEDGIGGSVPEWVKKLKKIQVGNEYYLGIPLEVSYFNPQRQEVFVRAGTDIPIAKKQ